MADRPPFAPPPRSTMGCSGSRSDLVKPQDLLTEASEAQTEERSPLKPLASTASAASASASAEPAVPAAVPGEAEPIIELVKETKDDETKEVTEATTMETVAKEDPEDLEEPAAQDAQASTAVLPPEEVEVVEPAVTDVTLEEPELSWFESATAGDLRNLSLHVTLATSNGAAASLLDSTTGDERSTALHLAAQQGHVEACRWLLAARAEAQAITRKKATALHLAAQEGHLEVLQLLLEPQHPELLELNRDAWPTALAVDLWRCSPLHRAAERGRSEVACYLLTKRADPQKADREGNSPLHFACAVGCALLVAELLKRKVPLDFANNDGYSPLDLCVRKKQPEVGDQLVAAGAKMVKDVKKTPPSMLVAAASGLPFYCSYIFKSDERVLKKELLTPDAAGRSALLLAVQLGHQAVVERLLDHPLCTDDLHKVVPSCGLAPLHQAAQAGRMEILQMLLRRKAKVDQVDASGSTALFHAAEAQQLEMLQFLLDQGLRPEQCNDVERTALHVATQQGTLEACRALLRAAESEALITSQDWEGATAVHLGIKGGHAEVCRFLMEARADPREALDFGVTPLQLAAEGHLEVLQLLLSDLRHDGAALRRALAGRQGDGRGAWLVACSHGQLQCARELREAAEAQGIDLSKEEDRTKRKAMTLAALGGHLETCKWLLETGSDVKERDSCQWTPLHAASAEGHTEVVEWLLKQGADVSAVDEDGHTAHHVARRRGCAAVEALLRRFAAQAAGA